MRLTLLTLTVRDYDEAIAFYTQVLGFELLEDTNLGPGPDGYPKRWVRVTPPVPPTAVPPRSVSSELSHASSRLCILLARAATPQQLASVGNQTGGRVFLFLETDDLARDYAALRSRGVRFVREPKRELYGAVAVFDDLYGNRFDLIQRNPPVPL